MGFGDFGWGKGGNRLGAGTWRCARGDVPWLGMAGLWVRGLLGHDPPGDGLFQPRRSGQSREYELAWLAG
ncbi:hypothetical protein JCM18909_882 [Cutibacterium acnes JCM 18909]|nr:hypothetical protein JCM18909_882 [Cutibacterium acnes JCM 18909]